MRMFFVPVDPRLPRHPKTLAMCDMLGMTPLEVWPRVVLIWMYAFEFKPDGDITAFLNSGQLGLILGLNEDGSHAFRDAMIRVGFLEKRRKRLILHDWFGKGAGRLFRHREQDKERKRTSRGHPADIRGIPALQGQGQGHDSNKDSKTLSGDKPPKIPYQEIFDLFIKLCVPPLPRPQRLSEKRKAAIRVRWQEFPKLVLWENVFLKVKASDFLTGRSGKWQTTFDWILERGNMDKILEGNYANLETPAPKSRGTPLYENPSEIPSRPVRLPDESDADLAMRVEQYRVDQAEYERTKGEGDAKL